MASYRSAIATAIVSYSQFPIIACADVSSWCRGRPAPPASHCATLRCRLVSRQCRLLAEAVEKVGADRIIGTIDLLSSIFGAIDSISSRNLNHCFKISDPRDFFNSLSQEQPWRAPPLGPDGAEFIHCRICGIAI